MDWLNERWAVVTNDGGASYRIRNSITGEFFSKIVSDWISTRNVPVTYDSYSDAIDQAQRLTWVEVVEVPESRMLPHEAF